MKIRYLPLLLIPLLLLATACAQKADPPSSIHREAPAILEESLVAEASEEPEAPESSHPGDSPPRERQASIPSLPDFSDIPLSPLPFSVSERWNKRVELVYQSNPPSADFVRTMENWHSDERMVAYDQNNFLVAGDYLIYYTVDSPMGPSQLIAEHLDGTVQVLLTTQSGIQEMSLSFPHTLTLCIADSVHFEGYSGTYHTFDLTTGTLAGAPHQRASTGHGTGHRLYQGYHYWLDHAVGITDPGQGYDIYLDLGESYDPILQFVTSITFALDAIFFTDREGTSLYEADLTGSNAIPLLTAGAPIQSFLIREGGIYYLSGEQWHRWNGDESVPVDDIPLLAADDGYYTVKDAVLTFHPDGGGAVPLLGNFTHTLLAARGDHIYFETFESGEINRTRTWRVKTDGSDLTLLNHPT